MSKLLKESVKGSKNTFNVRIIRAGQGSSGFYTPEVLKEDGPTAFPKGTHCFLGHTENGSPYRTAEHIVGTLQADPVWVEEEEALYAPVKFTTRGMRIVEELKDDVGMSINAGGRVSEDGVVEAITYHPNNAIDLVPRAGAGGAILDLMESFRNELAAGDKQLSEHDTLNEATAAEQTGADERIKMTEEDIAALAASLTESLKPLFTGLVESLAPVVEEDVDEDDAPDLVAATEAATEAGLPAVQREAVRAEVAAGATLEEAIKKQKDLRDSILAESATDGGGRVISGKREPVDLSIEWK